MPIEVFDYFECNTSIVLNGYSYLGYNIKEVCRVSNIKIFQQELVQKNLIIFTKALVFEIRSKLPTNIKILKKLSLFKDYYLRFKDIITLTTELYGWKNDIEEMENCLSNIKVYQ